MKESLFFPSRSFRRFLPFLLPAVLCSFANAQERSMDAVVQLARQHFIQQGVGTRGNQSLAVIPSSTLISLPDAQEAFYLCQSEGNGFVLISAEQQMPEVLGYSETDILATDALPDGLLSVLQGYSQLRNSLAETRVPQSAKAEVAPMLKTQWDQAEPYNRNCPAQSVAGCVATAAAQVMRYYEHPKKSGVGTIDYVTETKKMHVNINLTDYSFAWDLMLDTYLPGAYSNAQSSAVSKLIYAIGAACKMDFGQNDSGASLITCAQALNQYFGYDEDMYLLYGECVSFEHWNELLVKELNQSRPVLFSGVSKATRAGHAFVLDGYKTQQEEIYYHVNWGWNGKGNGYYLINKLNPTDENGKDLSMGSYDSEQLMLLNFQPDDGAENAKLAGINQVSLSKTEFEAGEKVAFDVDLDLLHYMQLNDFVGSILFQVENEQGEVVKEIEKQNFRLSADGIVRGSLSGVQFPSLTTGQYQLRVSLKEQTGKQIELLTNEPWPVFKVGDTENAIAAFPLADGQEKVVDLFGRTKKNADKHQLPAGFYIIDGRKTLVK